ncbi:cytochrome P450 [Penicillium cosmopolitanum]|uniref:Cytochrome P450 n=1 Tax=Penicillium cosmopolitanum TaxID=1131564 RepID=A0A9W9VRW8_9EURO|nr:cytochrome P450 [Penicillium cosmopolitanum]KAJ5388208.1 cytochrome P450 [Penicillium cosmopolitanum]
MFAGYLGKTLDSITLSPSLLFYATGTVLIARLLQALTWRWWFHPFASVPGPRLAAVSSLWQIWQDVFRDGDTARAIDKLHQEHNTDIIRISPNHVHIKDPDFYFKLRFDKDPDFYSKLGVPHSILSADTKSARAMRSKASAIVAPRDWGVAAHSQRGEEINLFHTIRTISTDIICNLCFGFAPGFVKRPEDASQLFNVLDMCLEGLWFTVHIPYLAEYLNRLPKWLLKILLPGLTYFKNQSGEWVDETLRNSRNSSVEDRKTTIMDALNPSPNQNIGTADRDWLIDQANTFVFAGVDTTSTMLMYTFHKVLSSREIHSRLQHELRNANISIQEGYDWKAVRDLPYLTAVIKEGLRLSAVIPGRLPRTVPAGGVEYKETFLPGTVVSSTIYSMHHNSTIFPDPDIFSPDRWLAENSVELERYNVAFSKGKRSCIGMK